MIIGAPTFPAGDTSSGGHGAQIDNIKCEGAVLTYHVHAHVTLFHNGSQIAIPLAIGAPNPTYIQGGTYVETASCWYHLHTHDSSGLVHVENPSAPAQPFTLGQFFDIWGQPLTTSNIAGFTGSTLVYLGTSLYTGDPRTIQFTCHEQITLEVGGPYVFPPFYTWTIPSETCP